MVTPRSCAGCGRAEPDVRFYRRATGRVEQPCNTCKAARKAKPTPEQTRVRWLRQQYGITVETYDALLHAQNGKCAICHEAPEGRLAVDHDHATGKVRGLLCSACNTGIGHLRDSVPLLASAIQYLSH